MFALPLVHRPGQARIRPHALHFAWLSDRARRRRQSLPRRIPYSCGGWEDHGPASYFHRGHGPKQALNPKTLGCLVSGPCQIVDITSSQVMASESRQSDPKGRPRTAAGSDAAAAASLW